MYIEISKNYDSYHNIQLEKYIQAEIYHQSKLKNILCFLEVTISGSRKLGRVDVLLKIDEKFVVIECKQNLGKKIDISTCQLKRYKKLKIPIIVINDINHVKHVIDLIIDNNLKARVYTYNSLKREIKKEKYEREKEISQDDSNPNRTGNVEVFAQDFI